MYQEIRSNKASEKLHDMIETTAAVERNGIRKEIPIDEIVPGDIVHLAAGDMVPADLMILNAKDLFITQSALTGESEPVEKMAGIDKEKEYRNALEVNNLCFMGTSVSSGRAKALVLNTGNNTFFGRIARSISKKRPKTNFDKGIRSVSLLLLITTLIMVIVVFVLQGSLSSQENRW
jgi:Mg2+-importing ATPase